MVVTTIKKGTKERKSTGKKDTTHAIDPGITETLEDNDLQTADKEPETEVEETESLEDEREEANRPLQELRRSQRERKLPQRLGLYYTHQITHKPVDRRLQTLQMLLGTGVFEQLDSDMTHNILDAVMK